MFPSILVEVKYLSPKRGLGDHDEDGRLEPPTRVDDLHAKFNVDPKGPYYWRGGPQAIDYPRRPRDYEQYSSRSIFWCSRRQNFLTSAFDCSTTNLKDLRPMNPRNAWEEMEFQDVNEDNPMACTTLVGHAFGSKTLNKRAPRGWIPELLPQSVDCQLPSPAGDECKLAGELSIIIGLVAFGAPSDDVKTVLERYFRPGRRWEGFGANARNPRSNLDRGVVVTIGYRTGETSRNEIQNIEHGLFGPLIL